MQYYRCKCGFREAWGSMPPNRCSGCKKCGTNLATHPDAHTIPLPHAFYETLVETNEGLKPLDRCKYCYRTRKQIEEEDEHNEDDSLGRY
jgi:hypothetical protein